VIITWFDFHLAVVLAEPDRGLAVTAAVGFPGTTPLLAVCQPLRRVALAWVSKDQPVLALTPCGTGTV
jgi:hypothetical protein